MEITKIYLLIFLWYSYINFFVNDIEIMFIDENSKGIYTSSDVYNNVVYEGNLRDMSHEEMLKMFSDIILCFFMMQKIYQYFNWMFRRMHIKNIIIMNLIDLLLR